MIAEEIQSLLQTKIIGREIFVYPELTSTNDQAMNFGSSGHPEGVVIMAENQTAGRGRLGRAWQSRTEQSLCISILLRPSWPEISRIGLAVAVALARALEPLTSHSIGIKWPNDIQIAGKKIAGILCESGNGFLVAGIGFNISQQENDFPKELQIRAGSLAMFSTRVPERNVIAARILDELDSIYAGLPEAFPEIITECEKRNVLLGQAISIETGASKVTGVVCGINPTGALEITTLSGRQTSIMSGEVKLLTPLVRPELRS